MSRHRSQSAEHVRRAATCARGFTLAELLVVVVIMGVLATLGFASLRKEVSAAWGVEGLNMVQSIRGAEERWRSEHMMYLDVSKNGWYPVDPTATSSRGKAFAFYPTAPSHADSASWVLLRPTAPGPVRFGYQVNSGHTGDAMTTPAAGPTVTWATPTDNWYVIQALGDTNSNGIYSYYRASSMDGDVFVQNPGE